jgi:hypothetical protein
MLNDGYCTTNNMVTSPVKTWLESGWALSSLWWSALASRSESTWRCGRGPGPAAVAKEVRHRKKGELRHEITWKDGEIQDF